MDPRTQIASQQLASLVSCLDAASVADDADRLADAAVSLADSLIRSLSIRPPIQLAELGTDTDDQPAATISFLSPATVEASDDDIPF